MRACSSGVIRGSAIAGQVVGEVGQARPTGKPPQGLKAGLYVGMMTLEADKKDI